VVIEGGENIMDTTFELDITRYTNSIGILLPPADLERWCLIFGMLKYKLIDQITLLDHKKKPVLYLSHDPKLKHKKHIAFGRVTKQGDAIALTLAPLMMDNFLAYGLACYRDRKQWMEHVDLQFYDVDKSLNTSSFDITLQYVPG
jgi:hypothetical protein